MTSAAPFEERPPRQARSRESWDRVLQVGMDLFAERGWTGLTITEVCRRARVSAPTIYARVDGKAGLFLAVHERWLTQIRATQEQLQVEFVRENHSTPEAAAAAAQVIIGVFTAHAQALRALIDRSAEDPELLERGGTASRALLADVAAGIPSPMREAIVRAVYAECLIRTMYGPRFLEPVGESDEAFRERVTALAVKIAGV